MNYIKFNGISNFIQLLQNFIASIGVLYIKILLPSTERHSSLPIIRLQLHYVVVQLGKGKPKLFVEGPYEQTIRAVEALPIENSDILLLRLGRGIIYTRYVKPSHLKAR